MAIHNYARLLGIVRQVPQILEGKYGKTAICPITVVRGERDQAKQKTDYRIKKYASILILAEEDEIADEVSTWKENDIVDLSGFIATREVEKKAICPICHKENLRSEACKTAHSGGNRTFIYPIYAKKSMSFFEQGEAHHYLLERAEISNRVFLIGNVTKEPVHGLIKDETTSKVNEKPFTRFQIAVNRKYCAKGMQEFIERTDYPWVYSYGENSLIDKEVLHTGSLVFIDGALQSRDYKELYQCQHCGESFKVPGRTLEILSYQTEYFDNCNTKILNKNN